MTSELQRRKEKLLLLMTKENISVTPKDARPDQRVWVKYSPELAEALKEYCEEEENQ